MRNKKILFVFLMMLSLILVSDASAQGRKRYKGLGGTAVGKPCERMYILRTTETLKGEAVSLDEIDTVSNGQYIWLGLTVKTEKETLSVHVSPAWYLAKNNFTIEPNDKLEIKGSRVTFQGKPAMVAAEIKKGDEILKIREEDGNPLWIGWKRQQTKGF